MIAECRGKMTLPAKLLVMVSMTVRHTSAPTVPERDVMSAEIQFVESFTVPNQKSNTLRFAPLLLPQKVSDGPSQAQLGETRNWMWPEYEVVVYKSNPLWNVRRATNDSKCKINGAWQVQKRVSRFKLGLTGSYLINL
jgi:hypothetical protein